MLYPDYVTNYINITSPETLLPEIIPANATNRTISWKSSNTNIATVGYDGKVTAKSVGTAIITASAVDGSKKSASYKVQVMGGNSNFMLVNMEKEENVKKYLKRTNKSYIKTYEYDYWTGEKIEVKPTTYNYVYENPIYSQGWRAINDLEKASWFGVTYGGADYGMGWGDVNPYRLCYAPVSGHTLNAGSIRGKLLFYNIRGGDYFGTETRKDEAYRGNPY